MTGTIELIRIAERKLGKLRRRGSHRDLAAEKADQRRRFEGLSERFADMHRLAARGDGSRFITATWDRGVRSLEKRMLPRPPFDFQGDPFIMRTMVVSPGHRWLADEMRSLEENLTGPERERLLPEDHAGDPLLLKGRYRTSANTIHHAYHLMRYRQATDSDLSAISSVVEWGGGYGNLCKMFLRLAAPNITYTIVDLPLFSSLQWLYLASVHGEDRVRLCTDGTIRTGAINLVPLGCVEQTPLKTDLFVSTWALSECTRAAQSFVVDDARWFGAKRLLLAYQQSSPAFPAAGRLGELAAVSGGRIEPIEFLPGSSYTFC